MIFFSHYKPYSSTYTLLIIIYFALINFESVVNSIVTYHFSTYFFIFFYLSIPVLAAAPDKSYALFTTSLFTILFSPKLPHLYYNIITSYLACCYLLTI